jgi:aminoglycoside phosphotransferase (APT) family kinase protein
MRNVTDRAVTVIMLHGDYSVADLAQHARRNTGTEDGDALALADPLTEGS